MNNPEADGSAQDTQSETSIVLADQNVVVGFNDSGSCLPDCNPGIIIESGHFTGRSVSHNGGESFTDKGTLPDSSEGDTGDPVLARDNVTGTVYFVTLGFATFEQLQVFRSFDDGETFTAPVNSTPGFTGTGIFQDKPWITVDNFLGPGRGNVYQSWSAFAPAVVDTIRLTRSTDGGATWGPPTGVQLDELGQGSFVTVGPDHSVYVFWWDVPADLTQSLRIAMRKSTDRGSSFGPLVNVANLRGSGSNGDLGLGPGFRSNSFPHAAVNPLNGHLYVVYNDLTPSELDKGDIYFTQSTNGGSTWSTPVRVNDDETLNDQFMPTIAVTPDATRLMVGWYDRRQAAGNNLMSRWGAVGEISNGTVNFNPSFALSPLFPAAFGQDPIVNATYMGDYDQIVADNDFFYGTWGDNRGSNSFHQHQADARFAKVPVSASESASNLSVAMSHTPDPVPVGSEFSYLFTVSNRGPDPASFVTLTDTLPSNLGFVSATAGQGSCAGSAIFSCQFGTLGVDDSVTATVIVKAHGAATVTNTVSVASAGTDPNSGNNTESDVTRVTGPLLAYWSREINAVLQDLGRVEYVLNVPDTDAVADVNVRLRIQHAFDSDLDIFLVHPDGTAVELSSDNGGSGDHFGSQGKSCSGNFTTFDDSAGPSIVGSAAPFAGSFRPESPLSALNGKSSFGDWRLRILDDDTPDQGTLLCWQVEITPTPSTASADLSLILGDTSDPLNVADNLTWSGVVRNAGPATATATVVSGALPLTVTLASVSATRGSCVPSGLTYACHLGNIAAGGEATVTVQAAPFATATVTSSMSVVSAGSDPDPLDNSALETTTVRGSTMAANYSSGDIEEPILDLTTLEHVIAVPDGGTVLDVDARVRLDHSFDSDLDVFLIHPDGTRVELSTANGGAGENYGAGSGNCASTFSSLDDSADEAITVVAAPMAGTFRAEEQLLAMRGKQSAGDWTLEITDNFAGDRGTLFCWEFEIVRVPQADLSVAKTASPNPVFLREQLTYTVTTTNTSAIPATGVSLTDTLPDSMSFGSADPSQGSCSQAAGQVTCELGTIPGGDRAVVTMTVTPNQAGTITNTITASLNENDPNPANNTARAITTVQPSSDLSLAMVDVPDPVRVSRTLRYLLTVLNSGPSPATGVTVTDSLPGEVSFLAANPSQGTCSESGGTVTCNLGGLGIAEDATVDIEVRPNSVGTIDNGAQVAANETDRSLANNSAAEASEVIPECIGLADGWMAYSSLFGGGVYVATGDLDGDGCDEVITGPGEGGGLNVRVFRANGVLLAEFMAYDPAFSGGVRVAAADVDGDGIHELITAAGPGGGPHVRVWKLSGLTFIEQDSFFAYDPSFSGGVFVAAADVIGDGGAEIVTGAGAGGGPHVKVFSGGGAEIAGFFAYASSFSGGVRVAAADLDGGKAEIVTGAGPGGGPHVRAFTGNGASTPISFFAYAPSFGGGVFVAAGDVDPSSPGSEIVTGAGEGGGPHVIIFTSLGEDISSGGFFAYDPGFPGGVRVAVGDVDDDSNAEVFTGAGPGGGPHIRIFE